jgi:Dicarboxylate carrier protein MatC N-terminus
MPWERSRKGSWRFEACLPRSYLFAIAQHNGTVDWLVNYRKLLIYGAIVVAVAPLLAWLVLVVIGG